jgi:putative hydrolase of the HAD superfamily
MKHDFKAMRRIVLTSIATKHGEHHAVEGAVEVFEARRSQVDEHLYEDSVTCMQWLRGKGMRCCVLTNGSADLAVSPELSKVLELSLNAGDVGTMKPAVLPFMAVSQRLGVPPSRILYVGDSYANDVVGAHKAGMATALLVRDAKEGIIFGDVVPDYELQSLKPEELESKLLI